MNVLSIIDKIYESSRFGTFLTVSIIMLIILFCIVLFLGVKDKKKASNKKEKIEEEVNDITFDMPAELENIKEDVTFEMPSLTQNLENFKKNLEEEIQKEEMAEVRKTSGLILPKEKKTIKVLDLEKIEDTAILPIKNDLKEEKGSSEKIDENIEENVDDAIDDFLNEIGEKKNILEEKIFKKNKDLEIPILKDGLKSTSSNIEIPIVMEMETAPDDETSKEAKKDISFPVEDKKVVKKTIVVSGIGDKRFEKKESVRKVDNTIENKVESSKKINKEEQSGIYSTDDDF